MTLLPHPIALIASQNPDHPAIITENRIITYAELWQWIIQCIDTFNRKSVSSGHIIAFHQLPKPDSIAAFFALMQLGACTWWISDKLSKDQVQNILKHHPEVRPIYELADKEDALSIPKLNKNSKPAPPSPIPMLSLHQTISMIATSGSSGAAKLAQHTYGNFYWSALGSDDILPITEKTTWPLTLPLYHVSGLSIVFRIFLGGGTLLIPNQPLHQFIASIHPTYISMVPTQLKSLLSTHTKSLQKIQLILLGGGPIPTQLITDCQTQNIRIAPTYGLTEMTSQVCTHPDITPTNSSQHNTQSTLTEVGQPLRYRELKISKTGEILVRGKVLFKGYYDKGLTTLPLTENGWFATGDLGQLNTSGHLHVLGRKDNLIISGGENIHPEEIESALLAIPQITQAKVLPKPDDQYGQRPTAYIETHEKIDITDLKKSLKKTLPKFKIPEEFLPISELKTPLKWG